MNEETRQFLRLLLSSFLGMAAGLAVFLFVVWPVMQNLLLP